MTVMARAVVALVAGVTMALAGVAPGVVSAHEDSTTSSPASGSQVDVVDEVRVDFGVEVSGPALRMLDAADNPIVGDTQVDGGSAAGDYTVQYTAQAVDGHLVAGAFEFTVGDAAAGGSSGDPVLGAVGVVLIVVGVGAGMFWWLRGRRDTVTPGV
jgi:methionine-rich copper-binding protein CopC